MTECFVNDGQPFRTANAEALGLNPRDLRDLVRTKRVRPVFRGVYVDTRIEDTRTLRASALDLVKPADAVFYGATVAFLLGVETFAPKDRFNFDPQCVVPHHEGRCRRPSVRCREGYLPPADLMELEGLQVTTPVRATADMLRTMWRPHALAAADAMAHAGFVEREQVMAYVAKLRKYPGVVQARALAAMIEPLAESAGESWQRLRLIDAGLPTPDSQLVVVDRRGVHVARLDNGYWEARVGIEYDGREWHDDDEAEGYDESRRTFLTDSLGWRLSIARRDRIFGTDDAFEREIAGWLGIRPQPRRW